MTIEKRMPPGNGQADFLNGWERKTEYEKYMGSDHDEND